MNRVLILIFLTISCVYYNTFYNAQKYYYEGLKQKEEGGKGNHNFQKSIDKCKKLLSRYPDSKYVDDAIFLIGMNFYHLNQYDKAKSNLNSIIQYYPNSPFYDKSLLFLGKIALNEGGISEAVLFLDKATDSKDYNVRMEAFKTKLEIFLYDATPEKAIIEGEKFIEKYGKHKAEVYYIMGNAYINTGRYSEALKMYRLSLKESKGTEIEGLRYKLVNSLIQLDSLENALKVIGEEKVSDSLSLLKAKILRKTGKYEEAATTIKPIINWRNRVGAIANYEMGLIKEEQGELQEAKNYFTKSLNIGNFGIITNLSRAKEEILELLTTLNNDSIDKDTNTVSKNPAYSHFRIGELHYIELDKPMDALKWYEITYKNYPESPYAPKALYVIINIYSGTLKDTMKVREYLNILKESYRGTEYSEQALKEYNGYLQDTTGTGE